MRISTEGRARLSSRLTAGISGFVGALSGVAPHVLHHVGPLAGAALFAGLGGTLLFGAIGLIVALPFLIQLYRRFASLLAPAIALTVFAAGFSLSTFVIGPAVQSALLTAVPSAIEPASQPQPAEPASKARDIGDTADQAPAEVAGEEADGEHKEHHP